MGDEKLDDVVEQRIQYLQDRISFKTKTIGWMSAVTAGLILFNVNSYIDIAKREAEIQKKIYDSTIGEMKVEQKKYRDSVNVAFTKIISDLDKTNQVQIANFGFQESMAFAGIGAAISSEHNKLIMDSYNRAGDSISKDNVKESFELYKNKIDGIVGGQRDTSKVEK